MADYNRSEAYDLSLYNMPAFKPTAEDYSSQPQRKQQAVRPKKTAVQVRRESVASAVRTLKVFAIAVTIITLFGAILFSRISLTVLEREAVTLADKIKDAESENTRLVMQLNSSVSREKVEEYAISVLGMQKLERFQIHYFEDSDGDKVIMAGGELSDAEIKADKNS